MTIKFCKKCKIDTDKYTDGRCKPCCAAYYAANRDKAVTYRVANRAKTAAYRASNREKMLKQGAVYRATHSEKRAAYRAANRQKIREYNAAYISTNKDKIKAYQALYIAANRKKILERKAVYYKANQVRHKVYSAAYKLAHLEQYKAYMHTRRARKLNAGGSHTVEDIRAIFTLQKGKCPVCKISIKDGYHVDHVTALANGGSNDRLNLQLLCPPCNRYKSAKHPVDFMQSRGFLL